MSLIGKTFNNRYLIKEMIGEGGMSNVWLANDTQEQKNVAIKILKKNVTSNRIEDIIRFRNEATTVSRLNVSNVVKIYEVGEVNNNHYIVMEHLNGKTLDKYLEDGFKFDTFEAIEIICGVCEALKNIHNSNIIHRDLKPGNIIINYVNNPGSKSKIDVKLIDFGLAQVKEFNLKETNETVGTFFYMSPEQTGVIKRSVDERSDLYSLGVIFYQLLVNELPFKGTNLNSLIHKHIAKRPEPLSKFKYDTPAIIEKIVLKLLEKELENRYQSAEGLLNDLERFKNGKKDFVLGLDDKFIKLDFRSSLVGREKEFNSLKSLFDNVLNNNGNICFIGGEAGSGKTRLLDEFRNYAFNKDTVLIDGKSFSGNNKTPYGPIKDALNVYLKIFSKYSNDKKTTIIEKLRRDIGHLGEVILKLNPMMKEILGECPPLIELEPERENSRFQMVLSQFFFSLCEAESSLILVIDDLQWLDDGSFDFLYEIQKSLSKHSLLILGTFRSNEITKNHRLNYYLNKSTFQTASESACEVHTIFLNPFDQVAMSKYISNLLYDSENANLEISNFILKTSKGNPFFAIEILKQLIDESAIHYKNERWEVDTEIFNKVQIPSSVVDTLIKKISMLDPKEANILSFAAIIGVKFDVKILFSLSHLNKEDIVHAVDKSVNLQLIEKDHNDPRKLSFVHDRIREAFFEYIDPLHRKELYLKTAKTVEELNKFNTDKVIFELAYYYIEAGNDEKIIDYAYPAALKAKQNYANEEAIKYLLSVLKILNKDGLTGNKMWLDTMENIGEIYLLIGKNDEAIKVFFDVLNYTSDKNKKVWVYKQISQSYLKKGDWKNCEQYASEALRLLGEHLPLTKRDVTISAFKDFSLHIIYNMFHTKSKTFISNEESEKAKQVISIYHALTWSYLLSDLLKCGHSVIKMLSYSERKIGKSKELGLSHAFYSALLTPMCLFRLSEKHINKSLELRKELNDDWGIAQSLQAFGFYCEWNGEYQNGIKPSEESIKLFKKLGDIREEGMAIDVLQYLYYSLSDYKNAKIYCDQYLDISIKSNDNYGIIAAWGNSSRHYIEMGDLENAEFYAMKSFEKAFEDKSWLIYCMSDTILGKIYLEKGDLQKSLEHLERSKEFYDNNNFIKQYTVFVYYYISEAYIKLYLSEKDIMPKKEKKVLLSKINKLCKSSLKKTKKLATHYGAALRVNAQYHALICKNNKAKELFLESINFSKKANRKYEYAMSIFEYGKFLKTIGKLDDSSKQFEQAYSVFKEIGSIAYEKKLADLLGIDQESTSPADRFKNEVKNSQRFASIIELGQDLSSILDLNQLLDKLLSISLEVTGAQNGYIITQEEVSGRLEIVACKNTSKSEDFINSDSISFHIIEEVLKIGEAVVTTNAMKDEKYESYKSVMINNLKSVLCIPIKLDNKTTGVCYLDNTLSSSVFTEDDVDILKIIMTQAAISLENAKLYNLAITDGLTGLITHKHFEYLVDNEILKSKNNNNIIISILMFDIDHFKKFNDTYGHQAGDYVLASVSKIIAKVLESTDIISRYGGEEFTIMLTQNTKDEAINIGEKIRKAFEESEIIYDGQRLKVTISMGISYYSSHGNNAESLIKAADKALYMSKDNGRNMVTVLDNIN